MINLARGTKEEILVLVTDHSETPLEDLTTHSPRFDVKDPTGASVYTNQTATASTMTMHCLMDTTIGGFAPDGMYELWVKFDYFSETPKLGPIPFFVT